MDFTKKNMNRDRAKLKRLLDKLLKGKGKRAELLGRLTTFTWVFLFACACVYLRMQNMRHNARPEDEQTNHAMEPNGGPPYAQTFEMTSTFSLRATRALVRRRSSYSR